MNEHTKQAIQMRIDLESCIGFAVKEFEQATGLIVTDIALHHYGTFAEPRKGLHISADVRLP